MRTKLMALLVASTGVAASLGILDPAAVTLAASNATADITLRLVLTPAAKPSIACRRPSRRSTFLSTSCPAAA